MRLLVSRPPALPERPSVARAMRCGLLFAAVLLLAAASASAQTPAPEFTGAVSYDLASRSGSVQNLTVTIGDGGSGPFPAVLAGDPTLPSHALYRPRDLAPFGASRKLPIVAWANGACRNASGEYRNFLSEIASHGFLIVAIGPAAPSAILGSDVPPGGTKSSQLLDGVNWAIAENSRAGSVYQGKLDTAKIAVMGQSCGGLQAIEVSGDPRITTTVLWNSGLFRTPPTLPGGAARPVGLPNVGKEALAALHAPIAYFNGGKSDMATPNAADDVARISTVPVFFANMEVGHYPATYRQPRGGAFAVAGAAWLKWRLLGDTAAARLFTGEKCGLCTDPAWTVERKNIP